MGVNFSPTGEFFASVGLDEQVTHASFILLYVTTQVLVWKTNFDSVDYREG